MKAVFEVPDDVFRRGALRTALVARLSGATIRQLQYWHRTDIIGATVVGGRRGVPRLYSWIDYMKVRAAVKLLRQGVRTAQLRSHIDWMRNIDPHWYRRPLVGIGGRVHVAYDSAVLREAGPGGQIVMAPLVEAVLDELTDEGELGELARYSDAVTMDPTVKAGSPTLRGTRVETRHLLELRARNEPMRSIAAAYGVDPAKLERAIEFQELALAA